MQGAISNIEAVGRWFKQNESPYFTLSYYSTQSPTGQGTVIARNTKEGDLDTAWERLKSLVVDQTGFGRAQLNLIVYDKPTTANTPNGRTNIDILSAPASNGSAPGIGSMPVGYVDEAKIQSILDDRERFWKLERENEDLKNALDAPGNFWDKAIEGIERIGSTPVGMAMISKFLGGQLPPMPQAVNGTHTADNQQSPQDEDVDGELDDLEAIAAANGITLKEFLAKTVAMANSQPGMVSMLVQQ